MAAVALLLLQLSGTTPPAACDEADLAAILRAQQHVARGDDAAAGAEARGGEGGCALRRIVVLALRGWAEARALASHGGPMDLQGPVRRTLGELGALAKDAAWALEVEYADTAIRAAIAASQDERPEMELLLTHARDVSERLDVRERRAWWPRSFNLLAGELWFEVDRYADAAGAYDRAVRADASPIALVGLARALMRLERIDEACAAYRRVAAASPVLRAAAATDLSRCP